MSAEQRLRELRIKLPPPWKDGENRVRALPSGNHVYLSGHGPLDAESKPLMVGKLGRELNAILEELRSLRPVPGPGNLFGRSSMGTYRTNGGGSRSSAATTLTRLTVVNVLEDALECSDDLGVTVTHTVMKPQPMRMSDAYGYVGFDDSILDALESSNTWPWTTTVNGEYTTPVFMRAGPDSSAIDTIRAVQQRYRLVYVPSGITPTLTDGRNRVLVQEMVWPPYYATGGAANGGAPGAYNGGGCLLRFRFSMTYPTIHAA